MQPLCLRAFPCAIIHIDADAFFASCEQAVNPKLKGQPVVTGKERGIASAVSYEAKALGIKRGMTIREIKTICPEVIHLPSDYETYSLFSQRMFTIVRRYTERVEEYSIDECFADLTGLRRPLRLSYEAIAARIKEDLEQELGLTFSLGLAPTKVVAKIASKWQKPAGLTVIPGTALHEYLGQVALEDVWGIGPQTTAYLSHFGFKTALDLARQSELWIRQKLTKPHVEIWHELRGASVIPLQTEAKHDYQSISKMKTFTPPTADRAFLLAQLSKNVENACVKARRHHLEARRVFFLLRTQAYRHYGYELTLSHPTAMPHVIVAMIREHFDKVYRADYTYRMTGIVLSDLRGEGEAQLDLFGEVARAERVRTVYEAIDRLDAKYGKHTVFLGSSYGAINGVQHQGKRGERPRRQGIRLKGEGKRKRLGMPLLGEVQ